MLDFVLSNLHGAQTKNAIEQDVCGRKLAACVNVPYAKPRAMTLKSGPRAASLFGQHAKSESLQSASAGIGKSG